MPWASIFRPIPTAPVRPLVRRSALLILSTLMLSWETAAQEAVESTVRQTAEVSVRLVVVEESFDDGLIAEVRERAKELREAAEHEGGRPLLILDIRPGDAEGESVLQLAELLASSEFAKVRTVAWVRESLSGLRGILPLVCAEIVLPPDAELSGLTDAEALTDAQRQRVITLVARQNNRRIPPALAASMLDPQATLLRVRVAGQDGQPETRLITPEDLTLLRQAGIEVADLETIKRPGMTAVFSGRQAVDGGYLVTHLATSADELARLYGLDPSSFREPVRVASARQPVLIRIEGDVEPILTEYVRRQIQRAIDAQADLIIFEIDSPGGRLDNSLEMAFAIADLEKRGIRTVAYIPREAISGGAIIALGCDEIYLHPRGKIGDAGPVLIGLDGVHRAPEKIVSYLRGHLAELAELKGRSPTLLMAMADRQLVVYRANHRTSGRVAYLSQSEIDASNGEWVKGPVVPESEGELLLTVNGDRAHELRIARPPVQSLGELQQRLGIGSGVRIREFVRTWVDDTVLILNSPTVTGLLFFFAVLFLFVELHFLIGIFGILSGLCFVLFFWSKFLGGTAGWLEVVLFSAGLCCLAIELFVIPGFGVFGVSGGLLLLSALIMASVSYSGVDQEATYAQSWAAVKSLTVALVAVIGAGAVLSRFLPHIPVLNAMILAPPNLGAPVMRSGTLSGTESELIGRRGEAETMLRPSGKVRIDGRLIDAVSTGGFVPAGHAIEVVSVVSGRTMVRAVEEVAAAEPEAEAFG